MCDFRLHWLLIIASVSFYILRNVSSGRVKVCWGLYEIPRKWRFAVRQQTNACVCVQLFTVVTTVIRHRTVEGSKIANIHTVALNYIFLSQYFNEIKLSAYPLQATKIHISCLGLVPKAMYCNHWWKHDTNSL